MRQFLPPPKRWGYPCCKLIDEWILVSGLDIDSETKREAIEECKRVIDEFLENGAS